MTEDFKTKSFLIANPDTGQNSSLRATIKAAGVTNCEVVENGSDAWQAWKREKDINVLISAWSLPEMSGLDFLKRVRSDQGRISQPTFIMILGVGEENRLETAVSEGADAVIVNPFDGAEFLAVINEGLGTREQLGNKPAVKSTKIKKPTIADSLLNSLITGELIFERYSTSIECDELFPDRCIIRVDNNYGLGTMLNIRFAHQSLDSDEFYKPIKGLVMKVERVPKEVGTFRLHVQFSKSATAEHGIHDLMSNSSTDIQP